MPPETLLDQERRDRRGEQPPAPSSPRRLPRTDTDERRAKGPGSEDPLDDYLSIRTPSHPSYAVRKTAAKAIRSRAEELFHGRMLEIGCGGKEKGDLVGDLVDEHIGLDLKVTPHQGVDPDVFGTAYNLPFREDSIDCVLSTAVLEHLETPQIALEEAYRALVPGGHAIYTAPLYWHLHEQPRDFFRYTKHGLRHLFEKAGFEVAEIVPLGGFWLTFGSQWNYYLRRFGVGPLAYLLPLVISLNNMVWPLLDKGPLRDEDFTWMYLVVARKPEDVARPGRNGSP